MRIRAISREILAMWCAQYSLSTTEPAVSVFYSLEVMKIWQADYWLPWQCNDPAYLGVLVTFLLL